MLQIQPIAAPTEKPILVIDPVQKSTDQVRFSGLDRIADRVVDVADKVTSVPERISGVADDINERLVDFFTRIKNDSSVKIKENLTEQKTASIGRSVGQWLGKGNNMFIAAGALLAVIVFLVRR